MATKLIFEDEHYEMQVFINQFNKIAFQTEMKGDTDDCTVLCLDNEDTEKLIEILQYLLNINR